MSDVSKLNFGDNGGDRNVKDAVAREKLTVVDPSSGSGLIQFGVDANGNYGYKKVGADTVTPFKTNEGSNNLTIGVGAYTPGGSSISNLQLYIDDMCIEYFNAYRIFRVYEKGVLSVDINYNSVNDVNNLFNQYIPDKAKEYFTFSFPPASDTHCNFIMQVNKQLVGFNYLYDANNIYDKSKITFNQNDYVRIYPREWKAETRTPTIISSTNGVSTFVILL